MRLWVKGFNAGNGGKALTWGTSAHVYVSAVLCKTGDSIVASMLEMSKEDNTRERTQYNEEESNAKERTQAEK